MSTSHSILVWLWLGLAGVLLPLAGQQPAFRRFGLRDGLPQSQVTALLEDRRGFLWVGTATGGVARLGASGFRTFAAPQGLQALFIRGLMEAPDGAIWVASQEGVSEIRGESVVNYGPGQGLGATGSSALALDAEDRVLVANHRGLFRREGAGFVPVALPEGWGTRPIRFAARDSARGLWLADDKDRLARWDTQGLHEYPLPATHANRRIRDLEVDLRGRAWVLLEDALLKMERGRWLDEPLPRSSRAPKMASLSFDPHSNGYLVALGTDGLLVKDSDAPARLLNASTGLPRDRIVTAIRDRRGVLWIGSDGDGMAAQALPGLLSLDSLPGATGKDLGAVSGILELSPDRFLFASSTGLYQVEGNRGITRHWTARDGLCTDETWALLQDSQGGVWVGTDRGLARLEGGRVSAAGPREMARAAVLALVRHRERLLAGTDRGLFELDLQGHLLGHHHLPQEVGNDTVSDILFHDGKLLLATGYGLWELKDGQLLRFQPEAPFATATVTAMSVDHGGRLWVGTMKGLHLLNAGNWISFGVAEGLPDEGINFILDVGQGRMAFGHNKGVTLLEGRRLHHLTRSQGLVSEETNHNGFLLDSRGRLWIGMIGGVCIARDIRGFRNAPLPAPTLLDIRWPGGSHALPDSAQVPSLPDFLDITFDTGAPLVPAPVRYEAFLEGVDDGWRPVNQGLTLQYRNVGAGRYRFHLRASTDGRDWVESRPVSIQVLPAWHERWLVRGLLALGLVALLAWILWLRVHALAERSRNLEETIDVRTQLLARQNRALEHAHEQIKRSLEGRLKLLDMVTHDLRSPLTTILLTLDRLRELAPDGTTMLDVMEREAHRIESLVRNLLDQSRSEALIQSLKLVSILPAEVTEGFEDVLRLKAEARGLAFHLEVSPQTEYVRIQADTATLHQVMLNLFENALKFTPAGGDVGIRSTVNLEEGTWNLEVWDTGRGLDAGKILEILQPFRQAQAGDAAQGWGLGLSICQSILDAHRGELKVESQPGQGARFRMVLPLNPIGP
jgi:signal transduction histidine kinase/ligand-binding sensor domain-containing protein